MSDAAVVHPLDGKVWITPLCKLLAEGCTKMAEYRVFLDHNAWCLGHLACEEHARAAREGRTREPAISVESLRAHEKRQDARFYLDPE